MKILHVAAEFFPLLKTGGLADVIGSFPKAQIQTFPQTEIRILLPGFPSILKGVSDLKHIAELDTFAGKIDLLLGSFLGMKIYVIKAAHLYDREGSPYHNARMEAYPDNYLRFAVLGFVASILATEKCDLNWHADIVHAHDWHAGLAPAYLHLLGKPALCVFTVHNLAYQGVFPSHHFKELGLPSEFYHMQGLEFYGQMSYIKAGLFYADHVTTVSPTYAKEIIRDDAGFGLHGILQERKGNDRLTGILNGVDENIWNPLHDQAIKTPYDIDKIKDKEICKIDLQKIMGLPIDSKKILFGVVGRLTEQKGLDWVLAALPRIIEQGGQFILLGTGDEWLQNAFREAASKNPQNIAVHIGYSDPLAHQFIAGADVILIPSRFEPCGLTQLYSLKYGTLPLVRFTGGLADTVTDCTSENINNKTATGFVFHGSNVHSLESAIGKVFDIWSRPDSWRSIQETAMKQDFSWENAAAQYFKLYQNLF